MVLFALLSAVAIVACRGKRPAQHIFLDQGVDFYLHSFSEESCQEALPGATADSLTLVVQIDSSAVPNLQAQGLGLVVSKGFNNQGAMQQNVAWIQEPTANLETGAITYSWTPQFQWNFVSNTNVGGILRNQITSNSPTVGLGEYTSFNSATWADPVTNLTAGTLGVGYWPSANALHPVLYSPFTKQDGTVTWNAFFYDPYVLSSSVLYGDPVTILGVYVTGSVYQANVFTGSVTTSSTQVTYDGTTSQTVCIKTPAGTSNVVVVNGAC